MYLIFQYSLKIDGLILLGLIVLDIIITLHFLLSLFLETPNMNGDDYQKVLCQFDGYLTAYTYVTSVSYNVCLSHCIMQTIMKF